MPHAISYVRFSSPKQALGDSLRRQLERTKEYCAKHGLTLDETLRDEGLSGYKGEHVTQGALGRFLATVEASRVPRDTYLILEHLDRFSRQNTRIALTLLLNLINKGVKVVTLFNEQVYSDTSDTIEHDLIGAILYMSEAHKASVRKADLIQRTWEGKREKLANGQRVPSKVRPAWLDVVDGEYKENPQGCAIVRRIFHLVANGMSTYGVVQLFNRTGVPALTGNRKDKATGQPMTNGWNSARIGEIIHSDAPLGWFQPYRSGEGTKRRVKAGEPIKGYYPVIVTQELADRARHQLSSRAFHGEGSGAKGELVTNLFSGLAKCALCGKNMHLYRQGRNDGVGYRRRVGYLRCNKNFRKMGCTNTGTIPYAAFERFVVDLIGGFSIPEGEAGERDTAMQKVLERLAAAKADATKAQESVKTLLDAFVTGASPLVMARIGELEAEHAKRLVDIAELEKQVEIERGKPKPSDELEAIKRILTDIESSDLTEKLLARTRVAAGMKRCICHFICFPNRSFVAEYDLGGVMCVIRAWLAPDITYEVYNTDWDWGLRKGKPWLSFIRVEENPDIHKLHHNANDGTTVPVDVHSFLSAYDADSKRNRVDRLRLVKNMVQEKAEPPRGFRFPSRINELSPDHLDLQPEDVTLQEEMTDQQIREYVAEQIGFASLTPKELDGLLTRLELTHRNTP
jgi:DNA invertase Pin-like site-specific DNA recombinase